ncbi:hypothetical protein BpHYR1_008753 [Brachionus plicatilis]|uniref:Uncharacterized protein n=1 Tax=Brachionus plicatilis TaxID=10195 RepID=A0A3M7QJ20_BRAPC|nr:hypothetical protein BpHYR1_008753 [Brachionus plicatilis]
MSLVFVQLTLNCKISKRTTTNKNVKYLGLLHKIEILIIKRLIYSSRSGKVGNKIVNVFFYSAYDFTKNNDNSLNDAGPIFYENPTNLFINLKKFVQN